MHKSFISITCLILIIILKFYDLTGCYLGYAILSDYSKTMNAVRKYVQDNSFLQMNLRNLTIKMDMEMDAFSYLLIYREKIHEGFYFKTSGEANFTILEKQWKEYYDKIRSGKLIDNKEQIIATKAFKIMCCSKNYDVVGCAQIRNRKDNTYEHYCLFNKTEYDYWDYELI